MKTITRKKNNLAKQVARLGLPPLRSDDGLVQLSIQEPTAKTRQVIENYPADRVPKVGDAIRMDDGNGQVPDTFAVMDVKRLLVPRGTETIRAVLLLVQKPHQA